MMRLENTRNGPLPRPKEHQIKKARGSSEKGDVCKLLCQPPEHQHRGKKHKSCNDFYKVEQKTHSPSRQTDYWISSCSLDAFLHDELDVLKIISIYLAL